MVLTWFWILPPSSLNNSIKFSSSVAVNDFLASVNAILNLWAPGALTLDEPVALSFNDESSLAVT